MQIKPKTLMEFTEGRAPKMSAGQMIRTVQRIYCNRMTLRDLCTTECGDCKLRLLRCVNELEEAKDVRNPVGLFTWKLRDAIAAAQDEETPRAKAATNQFGDAIELNPFEELLNEITTEGN